MKTYKIIYSKEIESVLEIAAHSEEEALESAVEIIDKAFSEGTIMDYDMSNDPGDFSIMFSEEEE
jgi:hypothetical protein